MNTEKLNAIKEIKAAKNELQDKASELDAGSAERSKIETAIGQLEGVIWDLVNEELKDIVDQLKNESESLKTLAGQIKQAHEDLEEFGEKVEKVAKIISGLVEMVEAGIKAGIIL